MRHLHIIGLGLLLSVVIAGCSPFSQTATPTAASAAKVLATAYISPTPNPQQRAATQSAISPTPVTPTQTVVPSATPYVGVFLEPAQPDVGFPVIEAPLFGEAEALVDTSGIATPDASACGIPIEAAYVGIWRSEQTVRRRMGCPIQAGFGFFGETQIFETGLMYHQPQTNAVWAVLPGNNQRGEYIYVENPAERSVIGIDVQAPLVVPGGVFGNVWLGVENLRQEMGFAQTEPQEIAMGVQRFENGTFLLDATSEQVFALVVDGTLYGPFLAPEDAQPGGRLAITPETTAELTPLTPDGITATPIIP